LKPLARIVSSTGRQLGDWSTAAPSGRCGRVVEPAHVRVEAEAGASPSACRSSGALEDAAAVVHDVRGDVDRWRPQSTSDPFIQTLPVPLKAMRSPIRYWRSLQNALAAERAAVACGACSGLRQLPAEPRLGRLARLQRVWIPWIVACIGSPAPAATAAGRRPSRHDLGAAPSTASSRSVARW
jgi:hypothetical protein